MFFAKLKMDGFSIKCAFVLEYDRYCPAFAKERVNPNIHNIHNLSRVIRRSSYPADRKNNVCTLYIRSTSSAESVIALLTTLAPALSRNWKALSGTRTTSRYLSQTGTSNL